MNLMLPVTILRIPFVKNKGRASTARQVSHNAEVCGVGAAHAAARPLRIPGIMRSLGAFHGPWFDVLVTNFNGLAYVIYFANICGR